MRAVPGRCTGGNGFAAAASLAFIIRRYLPASYIMRWKTALRINDSLLNRRFSSAGSMPLALAEAMISAVTAAWTSFGSPLSMVSRRASSDSVTLKFCVPIRPAGCSALCCANGTRCRHHRLDAREFCGSRDICSSTQADALAAPASSGTGRKLTCNLSRGCQPVKVILAGLFGLVYLFFNRVAPCGYAALFRVQHRDRLGRCCCPTARDVPFELGCWTRLCCRRPPALKPFGGAGHWQAPRPQCIGGGHRLGRVILGNQLLGAIPRHSRGRRRR